MQTIGIFTIDPWTLLDDSSMKKELLYFDHLKYFIRGKDTLEKFCNTLPRGKETFIKRMNEIEELERAGLITEYTIEEFDRDYETYKDETTITQAWKRYDLANGFLESKNQAFEERFVDFLETFREVGQLEARTNAMILNRKHKDEFVPLIRRSYKNFKEDEYFRKASVLSVIINQFPATTEELSADKLHELKNDNVASLKLSRLRNWAVEVTNSKLSEKEISQKLDYLLNEYKNQLDLHKIKYELGVIETFVTTSLEVLENIVKLNFSKAAKVLFDLKRKELTLLEEEEKLIGKEVAYLQLIEQV